MYIICLCMQVFVLICHGRSVALSSCQVRQRESECSESTMSELDATVSPYSFVDLTELVNFALSEVRYIQKTEAYTLVSRRLEMTSSDVGLRVKKTSNAMDAREKIQAPCPEYNVNVLSRILFS